MYRILGIDPGLRQTGFGVLDCDKNSVTYIKSGLIKTEATNKHLPDRLKTIFEGVLEIIETYKPNVMSIEKTFVNMNPQSSLSLGHARGMAIAAAIYNNMDIFEYTALQIKKSVVGHGHAKKLQVQSMVQRLLDLPEILGPDSSDALASALCHFRIAPTNILKKAILLKVEELYDWSYSRGINKKTPPQILVDCHGVGYEIEVPMTTFYDLPDEGHEVILLTHFVVREDAQLLFGFLKEVERKAFKNLIKVNGIGAKVALSILSGISIDQFNQAIASQDINSLVKIPGIGKKTAERLVLELKDKFDSGQLIVENINTNINDIMEALESLGYARKDIQLAIKDLPQNVEINEGIKLSLKWLSK